MATEDLSKTGFVTLGIKDPLPDGSDQEMLEEPMGFIPAERASTSVVAGQTDVNPLSVDLPDAELMKAVSNYSGIDFNNSIQETPLIGSSSYTTNPSYKTDATTGEIIPDGNFSNDVELYNNITNAIDQTGKTESYKSSTREPYAEYRNRLKVQGPGDADYFMDSVMAGQEPYDPYNFSSTQDFVAGFGEEQVVGNTKEYRKRIPTTPPLNMMGAMYMVGKSLKENAFIKGVKNNPDKYMGNSKYIKDTESWFAKQAQKQFGAIFQENPTSAIMVAEANKALYDYLQSTEKGRQKARDMGLNVEAINEQLAKANAFKSQAEQNAVSYSAYQGEYSGSAAGVAAKKLAYANMSSNDLNNNNPAGTGQFSGMAIGGEGVYVDISDGIAPGTAFKSGTIFVKWKKEERERREKENAQKDKEKQQQQQQQQAIQQSSQQTQSYYEQASGTGSSGSGSSGSGSSGSGSSGSGSSGSGSSGSGGGASYASGPNLTNRKLGGRVTLQTGGPVGNPMGQQQGFVQDAGNLEMVNEPNKDMSGIADDVPRELNEGDFVINAPAMEMAGRGDVEKMIKKAVTELQRKGVKLDFGQAAEDVDSTVQALVSNKEMIIPKVIAQQIGYDRLEKINNRGKKRVEEMEQEQQQAQNPIQPNPQQGMMAVGGQVSLDENKNQPIAVPQESFAGQSSVGSKLLSPMSPEAQDDEKELTDRSQSFEGFMKPVKLANGGKIYNNPGNIEANTTASGVTPNETYDNGRFAVFNSKEEGLAAIPYTLSMYGTNDIAEMVNRYKPSTENKPEEIQNTINYIKQQLGKDTFDLTNQKDVYALIEGITRFDSGTDSLKYYTPESMKTATDMFLKNVTTQNVKPNETNKIVPKPKPDMMPIQQQEPVVQQQGMMGR